MANTSAFSKSVPDSAKYRKGTKYTVTFPTVPSLTKQPNSVEVHQHMMHHDVVIFKFRTVSRKVAKLLKTGVPFVLKWSQNGQSRTIHGYVNSVSTETTGATTARMEVNCLGGSFPLKKRSRKVYSKKTVTEVAQAIAKSHKLKYAGVPHKHRFNQLAISGHSEWAWLKEHAIKLGYGIAVEDMTMVFKPLDKLLSQSLSSAPVMSMFNVPNPINTLLFDRTLDYFKVMSGENNENTMFYRSTKNVGGVNPQTGKSFTAKSSPKNLGKNIRKETSAVLFEEYLSTHVVNDSYAAKVTADGAAHLARLNLPAIARGQGDVALKPYAPVAITGVNEEIDGYWVVNSVVHYLKHTGEYTVEMVVSTDGLGAASTGFTPVRNSFSSDAPKSIINIEEALARSSSPKGAGTVALSAKTAMITEAGQGFNRTPTLWQATNIGPRKVC